jgi:hypothetical protein
MRRLVVIPLALAALCLSGCQAGLDTSQVSAGTAASPTSPATTTTPAAVGVSESPTPTTTPTTTPPPTATPSPTSTPTPLRVISPALHTRYACAVAAGKFPTMKKGVRFTARITAVNRGNIGASVLLKVTWTGGKVLHRAKRISVGYGKKVKLTLNAPTNPHQVTAFRANRDSRCVMTAKVLSYVGKPSPAK